MRKTWITEWTGYENEREKIKIIARNVVRTDAIVRSKYRSSVATGLICQAMTSGPSADADITNAANAQNELFKLHAHLVNDIGLEFDIVRLEWAPILDPSPEERECCEKLAQKARKLYRKR